MTKKTMKRALSRGYQMFMKQLPNILTWTAIGGVWATAYLTRNAAIKNAAITKLSDTEVSDDILYDLQENEDSIKTGDLANWKSYIPAVGVGAVTSAAIFFSNDILTKRLVSVSMALVAMDARYKMYREEIRKTMGDEVDIQTAERVERRLGNHAKTINSKMSDDEIKFFDPISREKFWATPEDIYEARLMINCDYIQNGRASFNDFREYSGRARQRDLIQFGWSQDLPNAPNVIEFRLYSADVGGEQVTVIDYKDEDSYPCGYYMEYVPDSYESDLYFEEYSKCDGTFLDDTERIIRRGDIYDIIDDE